MRCGAKKLILFLDFHTTLIVMYRACYDFVFVVFYKKHKLDLKNQVVDSKLYLYLTRINRNEK